MSEPPASPAHAPRLHPAIVHLADQALSRASGAPQVPGNDVRLLIDATENYPRWLEAIRAAKRTLYFETYIIHNDPVGRRFAAALAERARAGVKVRILTDWLGCFGNHGATLWAEARRAGAEVRDFNPFRWDQPLAVLSRDHRKVIAIDGEVAFVSGLCISQRWEGTPEKGIAPWRDTGLEIRGPAVADVEDAFAEVWGHAGPPLPEEERIPADQMPHRGDRAVRVIAGEPSTAGLLRMDQFIVSLARRRLWLTDAYFVGMPIYVQALRAAAADGVDVRILVPGPTDLPLVRTLSRIGYRSLLEAGIRIFEWQGPMLHAKTAVADTRWCRVGSSNLNIASFLGNHELDIALEDPVFAAEMEARFVDDLTHSKEIVLDRHRVISSAPRRLSRRLRPRLVRGSGGAAAAGALRIANVVGAAVASRRELVEEEARVLASIGGLSLALAVIAVIWPALVAWPLAAVGVWMGVALLIRAVRLRTRGTRQSTHRPPPPDDP